MNILPEDTKIEMEQRTDWGTMLDPDHVTGSDMGISRHDPSQLEPETADETSIGQPAHTEE